jgi:hypothetical protein
MFMNPRTTLWMPAAALALMSLGCSDPAPAPASVGLTLSVHTPNTPVPNSICPSFGSRSIGSPPPNGNPLGPGTRIQDGKSDVNVTCRIKGSTSFSVSATIGQGAVRFNVSGGSIDKTTMSGTFNLSLYTPDVGALQSEATAPCTFDVSDPPLEVSAGNVFARYNCPALWNRENATPTACGGDGLLVLEFCEDE